jgi:hypothetical protein
MVEARGMSPSRKTGNAPWTLKRCVIERAIRRISKATGTTLINTCIHDMPMGGLMVCGGRD